MIEQTLVLVKPDGVQRGIIGEVITRFEKVGLKIVGMKMVWVDKDLAHKHYEDVKRRHGDKIFAALLDMITLGPVVAIVLEGVDAVTVVRKMAGPTEPKAALPGTIRGDFAHVSYGYADFANEAIRNIVHASGSPEEAKVEVALWFGASELHDYLSVHELHTLHYNREELKNIKKKK